MPAQPGATLPAKPATPAAAAPRRRGRRAGSARSPASPRASGSPRCCRISGSPRVSASFLLIALLAMAAVVLFRALCRRARRSRRGSRGRRRAVRRRAAARARAFDAAADAGMGRPGRLEPVLRRPQRHRAPPFPPGLRRRRLRSRTRSSSSSGCRPRYDAGDRKALADVMTPEMFAEIRRDLDRAARARPTEVVDARRRGARGHDRGRRALGERPLHRHASARTASAGTGSVRRGVEPDEAGRRHRRAGCSPASSSSPDERPMATFAFDPGALPGASPTACSSARRGRGSASPRTPAASFVVAVGPAATRMRDRRRRHVASTVRRAAARADLTLTLSPLDAARVPRRSRRAGTSFVDRRRRRRARRDAEGARADAAVVRRAGVRARARARRRPARRRRRPPAARVSRVRGARVGESVASYARDDRACSATGDEGGDFAGAGRGARGADRRARRAHRRARRAPSGAQAAARGGQDGAPEGRFPRSDGA